MAKDERPGTRVIHPRIPHELHDRLHAFAARTHRTMNGAVIALLEDALNRDDAQPGRTGDLHLR